MGTGFKVTVRKRWIGFGAALAAVVLLAACQFGELGYGETSTITCDVGETPTAEALTAGGILSCDGVAQKTELCVGGDGREGVPSVTVVGQDASVTCNEAPPWEAPFSLSEEWFAANTGPRYEPTDTTCPQNFGPQHNGMTFEGCLWSGWVWANDAVNVTIRDSKINGRMAMQHDASGFRLEYVEIDGSGGSNNVSAIGDVGYTLYRSDIHSSGGGIRFSGRDIEITETWVHDLYNNMPPETDPHRGCIATNGYAINFVIQRNYVDCTSDLTGLSGALTLYNQGIDSLTGLSIDNGLVEENFLDGSGSYLIYGGASGNPVDGPSATNLRFVGNRFGSCCYGPPMSLPNPPVRINYGHLANWDGSQPGNVWVDNLAWDYLTDDWVPA